MSVTQAEYDNYHDRPDDRTTDEVSLSDLLERNCELCVEALSYNEDRQLWCTKLNKEVFGNEATKCKYYL